MEKDQQKEKVEESVCKNDEYTKKAEGLLNDLLKSVNSNDGWKKVSEKPGFSLYRRSTEETSIHLFRGSGIIDVPKEVVRDLAWNVTARPTFDQYCMSFVVKREICDSPNTVHLALLKLKSPMPLVSPRDCALLRVTCVRDDIAMVAAVSVDDPLMPEEKGFVRSYSLVSGWVIEDIDDDQDNSQEGKKKGKKGKKKGNPRCRVTLTMQADPGGWVPSKFVNVAGPTASHKSFSQIREIAEKNYKQSHQ